MVPLSEDLKNKLEKKYGKQRRIENCQKIVEKKELFPGCAACGHFSQGGWVGKCSPISWCFFQEWDRKNRRQVIHFRNIEFMKRCPLRDHNAKK